MSADAGITETLTRFDRVILAHMAAAAAREREECARLAARRGRRGRALATVMLQRGENEVVVELRAYLAERRP